MVDESVQSPIVFWEKKNESKPELQIVDRVGRYFKIQNSLPDIF